jgi:hypothetical protein
MRAALASVVMVILLGAVGACSPYSPSLSKEPFLCGSAAPKCPDGYSCTGMTSNGEAACVENGASLIDAPGFMCANDSQLGSNHTLAQAFQTPVDDQGQKNSVTYTGLAICPVGDLSFFEFTVTPTGEALLATITYTNEGAPLQAQVLNSTGIALIPFNAGSGSNANTLTAYEASIPSGSYYIEVQAASGSNSGENNFSMAINLCTSSSTPPCNM